MTKRSKIVRTKGKSITINIIGLKITVDLEVNAFYLYLKDFKKVHRTIEPAPCVLIDLDEKGNPLGVEILWTP